MSAKAVDHLMLIERELDYLGLLGKAREIYMELGQNSALSYIKSSYHLLSKVYHPDLNPGKEEQAKRLQQRLNSISEVIAQTSDADLVALLEKGSRRNLREEVPARKRILVVEDEFGLQETFRDIFLMEGYDVRVAVDGEDGYEAFLKFNPDLVFTDVVMPKMSGVELIRKIRRKNPRIKVIYISGFFGLRNVKRDLNEDMLKFGYLCLSKPFKISAMLELVDKYLNSPTGIDLRA
ncbi:MAG: Sporulation initiation phosphotransferase F [Syntrophaceae bacterium PtaU1.Bin231]|nr:MAG: Sporulation initiation phosphotransferase F [Syntrophaceae bacterium PtaU1.Bin231]HOG17039.1 response regulator [Syntrophales bacterium]